MPRLVMFSFSAFAAFVQPATKDAYIHPLTMTFSEMILC